MRPLPHASPVAAHVSRPAVRLVFLTAWTRAKICAGLYQNNGTGRDTFINMYRKGSGRTSEPGGYQGNCGFYGAGITRFSGHTPYVEPEDSVNIKPYSCHKELGLRPSTSSCAISSGAPERKRQWSDGSRRLNYDQIVTGLSAQLPKLRSPQRPSTSGAVLQRQGDTRMHLNAPKDATGPETHQTGPVRQWWTTAKMHNVWYVS